jgi:hypothetical protein
MTSGRAARHTRAVLALVCVLLVTSSCALAEGGAAGRLSRAVDNASSAVASAGIAIDLLARGRCLPSTTDTALTDSLTSVSAEAEAIVLLRVSADRDRRLRAEALAAVQEALVALGEGRAWVLGRAGPDPGSGSDVARLLSDEAEALATLSDELEAQQ